MHAFICTTCGTQYPPADEPPARCSICEDERQYVPLSGQGWTTQAQLATSHRNAWQEHEPGVLGIGTEPVFAIGQRALLLRTAHGNVLWDCLSFLDDDTIRAVRDLGGLAAIAISHPHFYAAKVLWSAAFGDCPVYIHASDREWVQYPVPAVHLWEGPSQVDRRHVLSMGARSEIPKTKGVTLSTTIRYMTGSPFTIYNSAVDVNRNGELDDPVPAGTYSGTSPDSLQNVEFDGKRNGARGRDIFQADVRAGWRQRMGGSRVLEVFLDIFNITNRANFENPTGDRRSTDFLNLTALRAGAAPTTLQLGVRMQF